MVARVSGKQDGYGSVDNYDLVGYRVTPSRTLLSDDKQRLDVDMESLLSSLAYPPPGVNSLAFDLRYLAIQDSSLTGKQLVVALLCRLNFAPGGVAREKAIATNFRHQFGELLSLHLEEYDYRVTHIDSGDIWMYLQPFEVTDYVELQRRVTKLRPLRTSRFEGRSPMSRTVDMLLRQEGQVCFSTYLEPHELTEDESRELELFGYESDILPSDDRDLKDLRLLLTEDGGGQRGTSTPFRVAVRLASDRPISQYVINLLGTEVSGRKSYAYVRPTGDELGGATESLANLRFFSSTTSYGRDILPPSLQNLLDKFALSEALSVFRLPTERIATSRERTFRTYHAPVANLPSNGLLLGEAEHPSYQEPLPVHIKKADRRRHVYIIGKTGTGKSMLLLNMIVNDINKGSGVCVVDPHGDLVEAVFGHIPESRANDVILFDPADPERVAGLNFLEATSNDLTSEKDFLVQEIIMMVMRMVDYDVSMYGPVGQQMTRIACQTLMALREPATLLEVPRLFASDKFRNSVLSEIADDELQRWWREEWQTKTEYQKQEVMNWFTSKFQQFISAPSVQRVVGQTRSTFDFKAVMDERKILLVNLSRGKLGSLNSAALGGMVVSKMLWAATRRAWDPEESRRDFYLYVDEFQNFTSDSFETILSEARKYRLNLVVAHQHLGQLHAMGRLGNRIERAVFGNVGTMISFRVGTDAGRIADELGTPVDSATLRSLQNRFCVAQLLVDDVPTTPFTMRTTTYNAPSPAALEVGAQIREQARLRNAQVVDIERSIKERWSKGASNESRTQGPGWIPRPAFSRIGDSD